MAKPSGRRSSFWQLARVLAPIAALSVLGLSGVHVFSEPVDAVLKVLLSIALGGAAGFGVFLAVRKLRRRGVERRARPRGDIAG